MLKKSQESKDANEGINKYNAYPKNIISLYEYMSIVL